MNNSAIPGNTLFGGNFTIKVAFKTLMVSWKTKWSHKLHLISKFQLDMTVHTKKSKDSRNYDHPFLKTTIKLCQIHKVLSGTVFFKPVYDLMAKQTNYSFGCPVKTGFYYIKPYHLKDLVVPLNEMRASFLNVFTVQIGSSKRKIQIGSVKFECEYKKDWKFRIFRGNKVFCWAFKLLNQSLKIRFLKRHPLRYF